MTIKSSKSELPTLPLKIAVDLAVGANLLQDPDHTTNPIENEKLTFRLGDFQRLAFVEASFKDCMVVFSDYNIGKEHTACLKLIHKHTPLWCRAYVAGSLIEVVDFTPGAARTMVVDMLYSMLNGTMDKTANVPTGKLITFDGDDGKL